jgi:hypothetical protein
MFKNSRNEHHLWKNGLITQKGVEISYNLLYYQRVRKREQEITRDVLNSYNLIFSQFTIFCYLLPFLAAKAATPQSLNWRSHLAVAALLPKESRTI